MSSAGGLQRRRVGGGGGGGSSSYNDEDDTNGHTRTRSRGNTPPSVQHAGSAFEGGSKIAFDPRDLQLDATEEARIGGKMPRLTIMEEVLLLGIKDKQVGFFKFVLSGKESVVLISNKCVGLSVVLER